MLLGTIACATRSADPGARPLRPRAEPVLVFENAGIEPVTVYLAERSSEWFVGYVLPGRAAVLRLPSGVHIVPGRELALVVVPSSARRSRRNQSGVLPSVIRSEPLAADHLTSLRWKLSGTWLAALPAASTP